MTVVAKTYQVRRVIYSFQLLWNDMMDFCLLASGFAVANLTYIPVSPTHERFDVVKASQFSLLVHLTFDERVVHLLCVELTRLDINLRYMRKILRITFQVTNQRIYALYDGWREPSFFL